MNSGAPPKIILNAGHSPSQRRRQMIWQTGHLAAVIERLAEPSNQPYPGAIRPGHRKTSRTCGTYWRTKQGTQDRSMDRTDAQHMTIFSPDIINPAGPNTTDTALPSSVVT